MKPMMEDTTEDTTEITTNTPEDAPIAEASENIPMITLASVLKLSGFADTGGAAKVLIQGGDVLVNGEVETRRKRKLVEGDTIAVRGEEFVLELEPEDDPEEPAEDNL
jgi:ribosome-associated protein